MHRQALTLSPRAAARSLLTFAWQRAMAHPWWTFAFVALYGFLFYGYHFVSNYGPADATLLRTAVLFAPMILVPSYGTLEKIWARQSFGLELTDRINWTDAAILSTPIALLICLLFVGLTGAVAWRDLLSGARLEWVMLLLFAASLGWVFWRRMGRVSRAVTDHATAA